MPAAEGAPQTLYDKVIAAHIVDEKLDGTILLYIGAQPLSIRLTDSKINKQDDFMLTWTPQKKTGILSTRSLHLCV